MQSVWRTGRHDQRRNESILRKTVSDAEALEVINDMIANIITLSRMLFSLLLCGFSPFTSIFFVLYLLCGITDILDGFIARMLHTESEKGATLDSIADLLFAFIYAVKILPSLSVPIWIWIWTALIAILKITGILLKSKKEQRLFIEHSFGNKLTGFLLFLLPLSVYITEVKYGAILVCMVATATVSIEIMKLNCK